MKFEFDWAHLLFQVVKKIDTVKNTVISPNYRGWKFYGKGQFAHSIERITRISTPENQVKLRYFFQCDGFRYGLQITQISESSKLFRGLSCFAKRMYADAIENSAMEII